MGRAEEDKVSSGGARRRWSILAKSLLGRANKRSRRADGANGGGKKAKVEGGQGVIRYPNYGFVEVRKVEAQEGERGRDQRTWYAVSVKQDPCRSFEVSVLRPSMDIKTLAGFNMTGNLCIWPSEECLAALLWENPALTDGKDVIELGAGMTGMAGLVAAVAGHPKSVVLTDGNDEGVDNLREIVRRNTFDKVSAKVLKWELIDCPEAKDLHTKFDLVICSDCLFFDAGRPHLVKCLEKLLRPSGRALVVAPSRAGTREDFARLVRKEAPSLKVQRETEDFCTLVTKRRAELLEDPNFDENKHSPSLLELVKETNSF